MPAIEHSEHVRGIEAEEPRSTLRMMHCTCKPAIARSFLIHEENEAFVERMGLGQATGD